MSSIIVSHEKLKRLRECLKEANEIYESLVQGDFGKEAEALPKLSPKEARENKFRELLDKK